MDKNIDIDLQLLHYLTPEPSRAPRKNPNSVSVDCKRTWNKIKSKRKLIQVQANNFW